MPTMLLSTLEDLNKRFQYRHVTTTGQAGVTRGGTVKAVVLDPWDGPTAPGTVACRKIVYMVETDSGYVEIWENPCFVPARQIPDGSSLIGDVQTGELTAAKFAEIVGIPLDIAEGLIEAHEKKAAEQT